jgi:hypothetical protein
MNYSQWGIEYIYDHRHFHNLEDKLVNSLFRCKRTMYMSHNYLLLYFRNTMLGKMLHTPYFIRINHLRIKYRDQQLDKKYNQNHKLCIS